MAKKIKMQVETVNKTLEEGFNEFIFYCKVKNLSTQTIKYYNNVYRVFSKFYDKDKLLSDITRKNIEQWIVFMKERTEIAPISINTYIRGMRVFLYYCMKLSYLDEFKIETIRAEKKVKEIYTDAELKILLEKPDLKKCDFAEYRNWIIVNFLLTIPVRVTTLINIKIKDIDIENELITLKVTKNKRQQLLPLGNRIIPILQEYLIYRKPETQDDYLIVNTFGEKLRVETLERSIKRYNNNKGVMRTGLHIYRNVYAKKWILAGGDIFRLQKILGHSSLNMVREYVNMFNEDIEKDFDKFNALEQLQKSNKSYIKMK